MCGGAKWRERGDLKRKRVFASPLSCQRKDGNSQVNKQTYLDVSLTFCLLSEGNICFHDIKKKRLIKVKQF